jgi:hypothetical protein
MLESGRFGKDMTYCVHRAVKHISIVRNRISCSSSSEPSYRGDV